MTFVQQVQIIFIVVLYHCFGAFILNILNGLKIDLYLPLESKVPIMVELSFLL